jgi:hypothetical protein
MHNQLLKYSHSLCSTDSKNISIISERWWEVLPLEWYFLANKPFVRHGKLRWIGYMLAFWTNKVLYFLKKIKILESWANPRKGLPLNFREIKIFSSSVFHLKFRFSSIFEIIRVIFQCWNFWCHLLFLKKIVVFYFPKFLGSLPFLKKLRPSSILWGIDTNLYDPRAFPTGRIQIWHKSGLLMLLTILKVSMQVSYRSLKSLLQVSYKCLTSVLQVSYKCLSSVLQVSYKSLRSIL